jgi:hypothetical protein
MAGEVMAVATRKRATRKRAYAEPKLGRTTYHVVDQNGNDLRPPQAAAPLALVKAQEIVSRWGEDGDEAALTVVRRTVFGDPVDLYRVVRDPETGIVRTYTTSLED